MRAIICALLFAGCTSLTVQPDNPAESAQVYFSRNVEPLLMAKCSGNTTGCHSDGSHVVSFDYAALTRDLDDNFSVASDMLLMTAPDALHRDWTWNDDARANIQTWLQLESAARGN